MASDATLPSFFTAGPVTLNLWRAAQIVDRKIVRERDDYAYEAHDNELPSSPHETSACLATRKSTPRPKQKPHTRKATHIEAQTWGKTTKITKKGTPRQTISPWEKTARKAVVPLPGELVVAPSIPTIGYEVCCNIWYLLQARTKLHKNHACLLRLMGVTATARLFKSEMCALPSQSQQWAYVLCISSS